MRKMKFWIFFIVFQIAALYFGWWESEKTTQLIFNLAFLFAIVNLENKVSRLQKELQKEREK